MTILSAVQKWVRGVRGGPARRPAAGKPRARVWCEELEARVVLDGAVIDLVPYEAVTHRLAVSGGSWSNPNSWVRPDGSNGVPTADANVLIPAGMTAVVTHVDTAALRTVRVDGTLRFSTTVNTGLLVDTMVVTSTGTLRMGTAANPVRADVRATLTIADRGPIDTQWDPTQISRGLISVGTVSMHGATVTAYAPLAQPAAAGQTTLVFGGSSVPDGWRVGDRLVVTGTNPNANQDETTTITSISGGTVTLSAPLRFAHAAPAGQSLYVANLTRNVSVRSQNPADLTRRGHVEFMDEPTVSVAFAGFYDLGRTDKTRVIDDPVLDAGGQVASGGTNPRGRYSLHVHRTGLEPADLVTVRGSVVSGSPGWGFASHSSRVSFEDNVAFNVTGSGFVTEAGDEVGAFRRNLAVRANGTAGALEDRMAQGDFGQLGHGFWFQGAGVTVEDNIAVGTRSAGFLFFNQGLNEAGLGVRRFVSAYLDNPALAQGQATIAVRDVPITNFRRNVAYATGPGFQTWKTLLNATHTGASLIEDFTAWNVKSARGIHIPYTNNLTLRNVRVFGNTANPAGTGIDRNDVTRNITYDNVRVEGFAVGINVPVQGTSVIQGGTFNNRRDLVVRSAINPNRVVDIRGDVQFGTLRTGGAAHVDVELVTNYNPNFQDLTRFFNRDRVLINTPKYNDNGQQLQLYYPEQAASFVPFVAGTAPAFVPAELLGKTNQELFDQYGLAIGGKPAPAGAAARDGITGLVGPVTTNYPAQLTLVSARYSPALANYQLRYRVNGGATVTDPTRVNLEPGWNVIVRTVAGRPRAFLVYGGERPPM
ncbi:MAG: hypothetical protein C0501_18075 [Isosphaera sp.]|nr:hypothetical protein [Isosphaera sp.]